MSRIIKFRAWDENNSFMFYHDEEGEFNRKIDGERVGSDFNVTDLLFSPYDGIIPMQFTGLTDKNGKEIYEGDWIRLSPGYCSRIEFKDGGFMSIYSHPEDGEELFLSEFDLKQIEVIGNIHEDE